MDSTMSLDALSKQLGISSGTVSVEEQEINIELNIESDEDGVPLDTTAAPEAQILDAQEDETELDDTAGAQEELEEAHEALEALAISIESYKATGGLTQQIAEEKYQQLDLITRKWGSLRSSCPSVESFGLESSQLDATISLENTVIDAIKKFWQTIVDTVSKWANDFRAWVTKILNVGTRLKKRAEAMKKQAGEMKQDNPGKEISGGTASAVFVSTGTLAQSAQNLHKLATIGLSRGLKEYQTFVNGSGAGSLKALETNQKDGDIDLSGAYSLYKIYESIDISGKMASSKPGITLGVGKPLPGGKAFTLSIVTAPSKFSTDVDGVGKAKKWVNAIEGSVDVVVSKDKIKSAKLKTLSKSDCSAVCDQVIEIAKVVEAYKANYSIREKAGKELVEFAKMASKEVKDENGKNGPLVKANVQIAQTLWSRMCQIDKAILSGVLGGSNALLNFVNASINAGKAGAKEEPAKKDGE